MIRVVRIAGESYDLETGSEFPKALILSNGIREFALHVDDETIKAVVEMMAEGQMARNQKTVAKAKQVKVPGNGSTGPAVPQETPAQEQADVVVYEDQAAQRFVDELREATGEIPADEPEDDTGYEPGEEYNDPATGVESL